MAAFLTPLVVVQFGETDWVLHEDLVFGDIRVPAGFTTDFASVPRLPFAWLIAGGVGNRAAVIHDYLYRTTPHTHTRAQADDVFYDALLACGVEPWRAYLMWAAVRCCGWTSYRDEQ